MYTFTGPGSYHVKCTRLLALVVTMYSVLPLVVSNTMYTYTGPDSYCVQCTRLLALVVTVCNVQVYWPW